MMRQYELVERVLSYDPKADEALLNRAYVYAMKAHGNQKRASGDPYFSHPLEVAAILTDLKLDEATVVTALLHDVIEDTADHARRDRPAVRARDRHPRRRSHQDPAARPRHQEGRAGREFPQAARRHLERYPRAARQARRSPAQHAHARARAAPTPGRASRRKRSTSTPRLPAAWAWRQCARSWRITPSAGCIRKPTPR